MERQLQALNPFETEEVDGLKKIQTNPKTPLIPHLICIHTRAGVLERSPAEGDMMGTIWAVWGQRGSCAAAVGPGGSIPAGTVPAGTVRIPLSRWCPVTQEVSMRKDQPHVPWAACAARCWLQNSQASGVLPFSTEKQLRKGSRGGRCRTQFPFPPCPPAPCHRNRLCTPGAQQSPSRGGEFGTGFPHLAWVPAEPGFGRKAAGISSESQTCWDTATWQQAVAQAPLLPCTGRFLFPKPAAPALLQRHNTEATPPASPSQPAFVG